MVTRRLYNMAKDSGQIQTPNPTFSKVVHMAMFRIMQIAVGLTYDFKL